MPVNGHDTAAEPPAPDPMGDAEDRLIRGMNHRQWLMQFSEVLAISPRDGRAREMTPFRAGAISRLKFASRYVHLLEQDLVQLTARINALSEDWPMTPPAEPMLQFFAYAHLPEHLQGTSALFHHLADTLVRELPRNPERTVALRKLLEAKDCAVRAVLYKDPAA